MSNEKKISNAVIRRLPKYYRYLDDLIKNGYNRISSKELSEITGFTASQIRQDLNNFGGFGQQGYGYETYRLKKEISKILGLDNKFTVIIVGAGNIGQAIANYAGFYEEGFEVKALFDVDKSLCGNKIRGLEINEIDKMSDYIKNNSVDIGVICTPKESSQEIADLMVKCGIKALWNFAPADIKTRDDVAVENVHMNESLYTLVYYYSKRKK